MTAPPRWATRLLRWFCDPELVEDLEGDLLEIFHQRSRSTSPASARRQYCWLVLRSLRPSAMKRSEKLKNSRYIMIYSNVRTAYRVLKKDGFNTAMNLLGLIVGIFSFLLLGQYAAHESSFDQFHSKRDRIYRTLLREDYGEGKIFFNANTPLRFESLLEDNFPEVEAALQYIEESYAIGDGQSRITEKVAIISPNFFDVFDFVIKQGRPGQVLAQMDDVILSERFAKKYFGQDQAMGQPFSIQIGDEIRRFTVSGIIANVPTNSSIQFDIAISAENTRRIYGDGAHTAWFSIIPETYVVLKKGASIDQVNEKMQDVVLASMGEVSYGGGRIQRDQYNIDFQPLTEIHLDPTVPLGYAPVSNPQYVFILGAIGWLVLLVACINYTSIATGQALRRSKEVGIRKALGAHRSQLVAQYLTESTLLALIAMGISFVTAYILVPVFNGLLAIEIPWTFHASHLVIALLVGLIAGIYPALVAAKSETIEALHSQSQRPGKLFFRKAIMVAQFAVTVFLITSTLIMRDQLQFLMNKDLGFSYEAKVAAQLIPDPSADRLSDFISSSMTNGEILRNRLEQYPEVKQIAMGTHVFGTPGWGRLAYTDEHDVFRRFTLLVVDDYYLDLFQIHMAEGRSFEVGNGLDRRQSVVLNKKAVELFGLQEPVGTKLPGSEFGEHQVIGVTEDFHFSSLHSTIEPLVIIQNVAPIMEGISDINFDDMPVPKLVFSYSGSPAKAAEALQAAWEASFPNERWNMQFLDQRIQAQYEAEMRIRDLVTVATIIAAIIAAMGMLGLSMLVANSKVKEIGIRKVMGASSGSIFRLMARGFTGQIALAIILSVPLTYGLMSEWLDNFAYRTTMSPAPFAWSALISLFIAGVVLSYHTIKAAVIDPIQSLRAE